MEFVGKVNPRTLIPIHTFAPEEFREFHDDVRLTGDGTPLAIG